MSRNYVSVESSSVETSEVEKVKDDKSSSDLLLEMLVLVYEIRDTKYLDDFNYDNMGFFLSILADCVDNYNDTVYIDIGKVLYCITLGDEEGKELWSIIPNRFDIDIDEQYDAFNFNKSLIDNKPYTIKSLAWYCSIYNSEIYDLWHKQWTMEILAYGLSTRYGIDDNIIDEFTYRVNWLTIAYDTTSARYYIFNNPNWIQADSNNTSVTVELTRPQNILRFIDTILGDDAGKSDFKMGNDLYNMTKAYSSNLGKRSTVSSCKSKFIAPINTRGNYDMSALFNSDPSIFSLRDRVVDISSSIPLIRDAKPEDYIVNMSKLYWRDSNPYYRDMLQTWFSQMFNEEVKHWIFKYISSCMYSGNRDKLAFILMGPTDTAKSTIETLVQCTFGSYAITCSNNILSGTTNAGAPNPDLVRMSGPKIALFTEFDRHKDIKAAALKSAVSDDTYSARDLYKSIERDLIRTAKPWIISNVPPRLRDGDGATDRRFGVVDCQTSYRTDAPTDPEERDRLKVYPLDTNFSALIPFLALELLHVMLEYYPIYKEEGIRVVDVEEIYTNTKAYISSCDTYSHYVGERLEFLGNSDGKAITGLEIYDDFKTWYSICYPRDHIPDYNSFLYSMRDRIGKGDNGIWTNFRFRRNVGNPMTGRR